MENKVLLMRFLMDCTGDGTSDEGLVFISTDDDETLAGGEDEVGGNPKSTVGRK